jgi:hypothetical protein
VQISVRVGLKLAQDYFLGRKEMTYIQTGKAVRRCRIIACKSEKMSRKALTFHCKVSRIMDGPNWNFWKNVWNAFVVNAFQIFL